MNTISNSNSVVEINICNASDKIVNIFQKAYAEIENNSSRFERQKWIKYINKNLFIFNKPLHSNSLKNSAIRKLYTNIGHLKRYRILIKELDYINKGKNNNRRSLRVGWEDTKSAFSNRIRSGIIINLKHIDPVQFLYDAFQLFKQ